MLRPQGTRCSYCLLVRNDFARAPMTGGGNIDLMVQVNTSPSSTHSSKGPSSTNISSPHRRRGRVGPSKPIISQRAPAAETALSHKPTAVVSYNDQLAIGLLVSLIDGATPGSLRPFQGLLHVRESTMPAER